MSMTKITLKDDLLLEITFNGDSWF